jgi:hypothetical protein
MIELWTDPGDRLLACSVFGTDDPGAVHGMILDWTKKHGFSHAHINAIELSVGAAVTTTLADGTNPGGRPTSSTRGRGQTPPP